ncbi:MAG: hypothetical protein R6W86_03005 [Marinobacter sp.]|uniref:hypothetical protein n=1 Tax=Marinobacter sp. TaxID=50741 RepID=UPI00396DA241
MNKKLVTLALASILAVTGCATTSGERDYSKSLYLRGQFAWWDALPEYKVKKVDAGLYRTEVELKADGQPYEFKFGDANWSAGTNCGYLSEEKDKVVTLGQPVKANCSAVFENFRFTPPETAVYGIYFDVTGEVPEVYIEKAE